MGPKSDFTTFLGKILESQNAAKSRIFVSIKAADRHQFFFGSGAVGGDFTRSTYTGTMNSEMAHISDVALNDIVFELAEGYRHRNFDEGDLLVGRTYDVGEHLSFSVACGCTFSVFDKDVAPSELEREINPHYACHYVPCNEAMFVYPHDWLNCTEAQSLEDVREPIQGWLKYLGEDIVEKRENTRLGGLWREFCESEACQDGTISDNEEEFNRWLETREEGETEPEAATRRVQCLAVAMRELMASQPDDIDRADKASAVTAALREIQEKK